MAKILFVYPNSDGYPIIPISLSILSSVLKSNGHQTDLFDLTFLMTERLDHDARERTKSVINVDVKKYWGESETTDYNIEFISKIKSFTPDIIAFSIVENNYYCAKELLKTARENSDALIAIGGLFPTVASNFFIDNDNVDLICIGEGEEALIALASKVDENGDYSHIPNMIVKKSGKIINNKLAKYFTWEPNVIQDWTIFDERHLLKPFVGEMRKTGFFELSRGCPFNCSYCINKTCQSIFKDLGLYNRKRPLDYAITEMKLLKEEYNLELIFFNDENFLSMGDARLDEFCKKYTENIGLPYFIMTRADGLLNETSVAKLKDSGCHTIGVGVEVGNEEIRKKVLNKNISNDVYIKAFKNCNKYEMRTTANIMIGLPFETEQNILESAAFVKKIEAKSVSIAIFAPYYGTVLRKICVDNLFMEDKLYEGIGIINQSILTMPQISKDRISELYHDFNDLVYGKS